jgi:hypothetical protein
VITVGVAGIVVGLVVGFLVLLGLGRKREPKA